MRISFLLFSACALISYSSSQPIQNPNNLPKEEIWEELQKGVVLIYNRQQNLTAAYLSNMMTMVYVYCTKPADKLTAAKQGTKLIGEDLYERLNTFLEDYLVKLFENSSNLSDEDLLRFYTRSWVNYRASSRVIHNVFNYLNRHWVRRELDEKQKDAYQIFTLTLIKWRDHLLKRGLNAKLTKTVLRMIQGERNGDLISSEAIRNYIDCYVLLGMGEIEFYKENFEMAFIQETEKYYTEESFRFFNEHPIIEYIRHAEKRFEEESNRVVRYLHPNTSPILMKTCERAFIEQQLEVLLSEFQGLLQKKDESSNDLRSLNSLVSRIPDSMVQLYDQFYKQVYAEGMAKIAEDATKAVEDPKVFIDAVFELRRSYMETVKDCLKNDHGFSTALDKALYKCINTNEITKNEKNDDVIPTLLAKYANNMLESKSTEDNQVIENLNKVTVLLRYVDNKDMYIKKHKTFLAKRLISDTVVSEENEKMLLSDLKIIVGNEFTKDMEQMLTDLTLSNEANQEYNDHRKNDKASEKQPEFNVKILKNGPWPSLGQPPELFVPSELQEETKHFEDFYLKKFSGRSIRWLYHRCKGEMTFYSPLKDKYILSVSVYQMAILLQFNDNDKLSVHEISAVTGIPESYLMPVLKILLKSTLFISKDKRDQLTLTSEIQLNPEFKTKKRRISLNAPIKTEVKKEDDDLQKKTNMEREIQIKAAIVRIMKMRQTLKYQSLVAETTQAVLERFKPDPRMIKQQIEKLIEEDCIARKEGEKDVFVYVA